VVIFHYLAAAGDVHQADTEPQCCWIYLIVSYAPDGSVTGSTRMRQARISSVSYTQALEASHRHL